MNLSFRDREGGDGRIVVECLDPFGGVDHLQGSGERVLEGRHFILADEGFMTPLGNHTDRGADTISQGGMHEECRRDLRIGTRGIFCV